jgi:hypothetical protein
MLIFARLWTFNSWLLQWNLLNVITDNVTIWLMRSNWPSPKSLFIKESRYAANVIIWCLYQKGLPLHLFECVQITNWAIGLNAKV